MLAYYLHDLSPFVIRFTDSFGVHWYGLAYLLGFAACGLVMWHLAKRGLSEIKPEQVTDFITGVSIFGVVLGGRLGYILLYGLTEYKDTPWEALKIWKGGMASHGGIAGIAIFTLWYARKHRISWTGIGDTVVCGAPLGVMLGRLANFINGELFGRVTTVAWAVKFPTELLHEDFARQGGQPMMLPPGVMHSPDIIAWYESEGGSKSGLEAILHPRHPSQLYEAAGEGLLLFAVLYFLRVRFPRLPHGVLTGLFFILYAVVRIALENYREPDSGAAPVFGMTKGQFFSTFMVGIGTAFLIFGLLSPKAKIKEGS
ncbi:MAG: prolipoprotein diacylglyceryl transferase [Verrucomicrobiaceae bacterium]|nr:prolipoprotein diacylglyceryl transferase [Verrucomicrobiaceae bacterium]